MSIDARFVSVPSSSFAALVIEVPKDDQADAASPSFPVSASGRTTPICARASMTNSPNSPSGVVGPGAFALGTE
ncbi:hypothetical protein ELQ90_04045 [Labedella phragmitis]|uniref:Uncharacterized protein n=1 Tax=Labedella phragmitis TaxID=2498849 RepID=A0A444PZ66_9MICO|nr:hypothetical protein [Labedella phragmitis]RWZ53103.1 hypothetical protein ELQ90_04045 [Labedella phragmitis]